MAPNGAGVVDAPNRRPPVEAAPNGELVEPNEPNIEVAGLAAASPPAPIPLNILGLLA